MVLAGDDRCNDSSQEEAAENGRVHTNGEGLDNDHVQHPSPIRSPIRSPMKELADINKACKGQPEDSSLDHVIDIKKSSTKEPFPKGSTESAGPLPITLKFEDVDYSVTLTPPSSWFSFNKWSYKSMMPSLPSACGGEKKQAAGRTKHILHGLSGVVKPGEILAMLGPSGSGKTTLLNVLGGRAKGGVGGRKLSGQVKYNESSDSKAMKRRTGFVTQDDVLFQNLTVKETLVYAAYLRLPSSDFTKAQKVQRAEDVIVELGLEKCRNTVIGGPFVRGVSGGERKRVSIGHEMLIDPSLLLLDEPTSGLDSTIALKIIHTLQDLAKGGRTIVTTIHQPSSIIYHTFTKLLLLSEGHTLYYGRGSEAMNYFQSVGFAPTFATNPADFLLDLASGITYDVAETNNDEPGAEAAVEKNSSKSAVSEKVLSTLKEAYVKTLLPRTQESINEVCKLTEEENRARLEKKKWATSWIDQLLILISRGMKERKQDVITRFKIFQVGVPSIVVGLLWWQSTPDQIQDQVGLIFFMTTFWLYLPLFSSIFLFPAERRMMMKERASGMYRLSAYFVARTIGELPLEFVLPTLSVSVVYSMTGLRKSVAAYVCYLLITLLAVLTSQGVGLFLGAFFMEVKKATTLGSVLLLTTQLAGGYFVQHTPAWISWIKYISFDYYTYKLQLIVQYQPDQTYACSTGRCLIADYPALHTVGINHMGTSLMALLLMTFGYRFLAYYSLRRMKISR